MSQLLSPLRTTTVTELPPGNVNPLTSTSTQPAPVGANVRSVHQANQAGGRTQARVHTEMTDALLDFLRQPPSPGTSQLLDRFEAIQESLERGVDAQALNDVPSPSPEAPAPIREWMLTDRDAAPDPPAMTPSKPTTYANTEASTDRTSDSVQRQPSPGARAERKRAAPSRADSELTANVTNVTPPPPKTSKTVNDETLLAIQSAVQAAQTTGQLLNKGELAKALGVNKPQLDYYVLHNDLTVPARKRLARIAGESASSTKIGDDVLLALEAEVDSHRSFNTAEFARRHGLNKRSVGAYVRVVDWDTRKAELRPLAKLRLSRIKGKAVRSNVRLETDYWQVLKSEVDSNRPFSVSAFADRYAVPQGTVWKDAKKLREPAAPPHPTPVMRIVEPRDLLALREELASGGPFDRQAWTQRLGLSPFAVRKYVTAEGKLTAMGLSLLVKIAPQDAG
ncbi:hypothetical protein [Pandoraea pulmonicola]|uniref:hypothetical protein n=1 Tax=Pandoraea pulmonicola TaxID=93221 RepID=UPI001F35F1D0|nr:hypothetical protein [Pandoraea pulmonicola]